MAEIHDSFPGEVTRRWPSNLGLPAAPLGARSSLEGPEALLCFGSCFLHHWGCSHCVLVLFSLCSQTLTCADLCSSSVVWVLYYLQFLQRHLQSSLELFVLTSFTF